MTFVEKERGGVGGIIAALEGLSNSCGVDEEGGVGGIALKDTPTFITGFLLVELDLSGN